MDRKEIFAQRVMSYKDYEKDTLTVLTTVAREFGHNTEGTSLSDFLEELAPLTDEQQKTTGDLVVYSSRSGKLLDVNVILDDTYCFGIPDGEEEGKVLKVKRGRTIEGYYSLSL